MQRATGALVIASEEHGEARLYFMFGTLYHAEAPGGLEGMKAVDAVQGWQPITWQFDEKTKLPTVETIGEGEVSEDNVSLAEMNRRDAAVVRQRAIYFLVFLAAAAGLMVFLFLQRQ